MVSERLQLESNERQRLEKDLQDAQAVKSRLAETNEQLEMQLLCMRSTDPSLMSSSSSVAGTMSDDDSAVAHSDKGDQYYRRRYERVCRELEYAKKRLQQQHNDDMEQLLAMKKQLEKKASGFFVFFPFFVFLRSSIIPSGPGNTYLRVSFRWPVCTRTWKNNVK